MPNPDPLFIYFPSDEGPSLLNLYQIVRVDGITDDRITVHTSDGTSNNLCGKEAVEKLMALFAEYTMTVDGQPLPEAPPEGPELVKPIDTEK
jgi:hypothetical protein